MGNEQQERVVPAAEPIAAWQSEIKGQTTPRRLWRWALAGMGVLALVAAAVVVTVLVTRPDKPVNRMTQELAVSYVQSEFPGQFTNADKLVALFDSTCHVLDAGGTRTSAVLPMIDAGFSAEEASYVLNMAIYSTCPRYAEQ